ncbi:uncharacterized protein N7479_000061 [Penicillium vulpinum]|uniref:uncharacterized protein n=1 Tax=Penicillium vulpinum TaxID=29845 RepID=UPI002546C4BF|nr:uncharacterized protein N7479_000061 [Penicillium vulpinum]KAJ5970143.1 hypothetical protein N7479_000061 [Penicillium vulpinum]
MTGDLFQLLLTETFHSSNITDHYTSFGDNAMTTHIQGYLTDISGIFAVIEVKLRICNWDKYPKLPWQETAEMVSWICTV